jgi:hypothetical protein
MFGNDKIKQDIANLKATVEVLGIESREVQGLCRNIRHPKGNLYEQNLFDLIDDLRERVNKLYDYLGVEIVTDPPKTYVRKKEAKA